MVMMFEEGLNENSGGPCIAAQCKCVDQAFEAQVQRTPDKIAVATEEEAISYWELNRRANRLARYLRQVGVSPDYPVGVCMERSIDMIISLIGILKAGGCYVPLDPLFPLKRLQYMLDDTNIRILLMNQQLDVKFPSLASCMINISKSWDVINNLEDWNLMRLHGQSHLVYVIYTSGSTDRPKGVMVEHGSLMNYVVYVCERFALNGDDRILQFASISFDTAAEEIFPCLCCGATLFLRPQSMVSSIHKFLQRCLNWRLSVVDLPTAFWHELTTVLNENIAKNSTTVRLFIIGGEEARLSQLAQWNRYMSNRVNLTNTYGPTETTIVVTMQDLHVLHDERLQLTTVPIGIPINNCYVQILNENLDSLQKGNVGEIYISGRGVARGYLNRTDLTGEKFVPDPIKGRSGSRMYRSGDLGRLNNDGMVEFVGRVDRQIKIRGYRIELGEVELALLSNPKIRNAAVTVSEKKNGEKNLIAYILCGTEQLIPSIFELRSFLEDRLPEFMLPLTFVYLNEFPVTPSGKIDRNALPSPDLSTSSSKYKAPQDATEEQLAVIWREILELKRVGTNENFFMIGGHSILATRLIYRIETTFDIELSLVTIYEFPTIEALANEIKRLLEVKGRIRKHNLEKLLDHIESMTPDEVLQELEQQDGV